MSDAKRTLPPRRLFKSYGFNESINLSKSNPAEGDGTTVDTVALTYYLLPV